MGKQIQSLNSCWNCDKQRQREIDEAIIRYIIAQLPNLEEVEKK